MTKTKTCAQCAREIKLRLFTEQDVILHTLCNATGGPAYPSPLHTHSWLPGTMLRCQLTRAPLACWQADCLAVPQVSRDWPFPKPHLMWMAKRCCARLMCREAAPHQGCCASICEKDRLFDLLRLGPIIHSAVRL